MRINMEDDGIFQIHMVVEILIVLTEISKCSFGVNNIGKLET